MARRSDSRWLVRSSAIALSFGCLAIGAMDRGSAQSFNGTPTVVAGQVDQFLTGSGTTDVLINSVSPQTVINWVPTDTSAGASPIAFQNAGTTTTFSRLGGGDFAVLNRILPTGAAAGRSVLLNGSIQGQINTGTPGGRVYFYTPNGLIIGANAQIDVGALGLTTSDVQFTPGFGGGFIDVNAGGVITFAGANPGSFVVIQSGAQINATQQDLNNYVAIFAPYIEQNGTINVNGSTALIAAEAGTMTWSNGLFDVQVATGTDGDLGNRAIVHTGSTGGPASGGSGDNHRIYTVAVPKNTMITTLIAGGSSLGFDVAGAVDVVGNAIILTAGNDLGGGSPVPSTSGGSFLSNIQVTNSAVTSSLSLYASGTGLVEAVGGGSTTLFSDLFVRAPIASRIEASSAGALNIASNVFLDARRDVGSGNVTGGNAYLTAAGGASLIIGGFARLDAGASTGAGGTATGGLARAVVDTGASLNVGGSLSLAATGSVGESQTGNAIGGTADIRINASGSTAQIGSDLNIDTSGLGGGVSADLTTGEAGGNGTGGNSVIAVDVGPNSLTVVGVVNVVANGHGGDGNLAASGSGFGGSATIFAGADSLIDLQSDVLIEAVGTSGSVAFGSNSLIANATTGGSAAGGVANLSIGGANAVISIGADLTMDVGATSDGSALAGATGGLAQGGLADIIAQDGSIGVAGFSTVTSVARAGSAASGNNGAGGGVTARAISAGALTFHGINMVADGFGGAEAADSVSGDGLGGAARMISGDAGNITVAGSLLLSATGTGGAGDFSPGLLAPGSGEGGLAELLATNSGAITVNGFATIAADGLGASAETLSAVDNATAGTGRGGVARAVVQNDAAIQIDQDLDISAYGEGGIGSGALAGIANGGVAIGGTAEVDVGGAGSTGSLVVAASVFVNADAVGGSAISNGAGGDAIGGTARVQTVGGLATIQTGGADTVFNVDAGASGGAGSGAGVGGAGIGGTAELIASVGNVTIDSLVAIFADGGGGDSVDGNAGVGYGGIAQVASDAGALLTLTSNAGIPSLVDLVVDSSGAGGNASGSGNGGNGSAGQSTVATFTDSAIDIIGDVLITAVSDGGDGYNGGIGNGNLNPALSEMAFAGLVASSGTIGVSGVTQVIAAGAGGDALGLGGTGGGASGGFASIFSNASGTGATITLGQATAEASAFGGTGASGVLGSNGGAGGSAAAGVASVLGTANNGDLITGNLNVSVIASGGSGGNGGDDSDGPGGDGGAGGNAIGGAAILGLFDGTTADVGGTAIFGTVLVFAGSQGGTGGDGGISLIPGSDGNGGAGGSATAANAGTTPSGLFNEGPTQIFAVGGSVTMGQFILDASARGGDGGSGLVSGLGGFASSGGFDISVKSGGLSGQRGSLSGNDVVADLLATPGFGGISYRGSGPRVMLDGGDAVFANLTVVQEGSQPALSPVPAMGEVSLNDSSLSADILSIITSGTMSVLLDNSAILTQTTVLNAGNFAPNAAGIVPVDPGVINSTIGVTVSSGNDIIIDASIASATDIILNAAGSVRTYDLSSGSNVTVGAVGSITVRQIFSGTDVGLTSTNGAVNFDSIIAIEDVDILAAQAVGGNSVQAGDSVTIESGDTISIAGLIDAGVVNPVSATGAAYSVGLRAVNDIVVNDVSAGNDIGIASISGSVGAGSVSAGNNVLVLAQSGATIGSISSAGAFVYLADSSMLSLSPGSPFDPAPIFAAPPVAMAGPISIGDIVGDTVVLATAAGLTLGDVTASNSLRARGGNITALDLNSAGFLGLEATAASGSISTGFVVSGTDVDILAMNGGVNFQSIFAVENVDVRAAQAVTGTSVTAGDSVSIESGDTINIAGLIDAGITSPSSATGAEYLVGLNAMNDIFAGDVSAVNGIGFASLTGKVEGRTLFTGGDVLILARSGVAFNAIDAVGGAGTNVYIADSSMFGLSPAGAFDPAPIFAAAPVAMTGPLSVGGLIGGRVVLATTGLLVVGDLLAEDSVFAIGGSVSAGEIDAVGSVRLESSINIGLTTVFSEAGDVNLLAGGNVFFNGIFAGGALAVQAGQDIELFPFFDGEGTNPASISVGQAARLVALGGSIYDSGSAIDTTNPTADITAGGEILLLAGNRVDLDTLTSSAGVIYVANSSMAALGGTFDNFQIGNLLESAPAPVGGSMRLRAVSGPAFLAASDGPFTIGSVNANSFVYMQSRNGLLSIDGAVRGANVFAASSDIAIGQSGSITGSGEGLVQLVSLNSSGARIGDGSGAVGYQLSAAELARVSAGEVDIIAPDVEGLPIDMVIGDLSVTGPLAGSTVEAANGALSFITGTARTNVPSGVIRVTGRLAARGFTPTNRLGFLTGTLQLDANSGLIEILDNGTQRSGEVLLEVDRFHAAQATVLDRLLEDPLYAGRVSDINTPLATSRPDGIVRAGGIEIGTLTQFLVQNTGTVELPAGILVFSEGPIELDFQPSPNSIDFIVNGQTTTESGTLTGTAVFDFLINDSNRSFFTPGSTINSCLISAASCDVIEPEPEPEPEPDVTEMDAGFLPSDSITHFTEEPAQEEQAVDPEEREEAEEEAKRAPIPPPTPIISTQPLAPVIDVDEPVAGAGNPGFISSAPAPAGQGRETAQ